MYDASYQRVDGQNDEIWRGQFERSDRMTLRCTTSIQHDPGPFVIVHSNPRGAACLGCYYRSMYARGSVREKVFLVGTILALLSLGPLAFLDLHGILRIIAACCLILGWLMHTCAFFADTWDGNSLIRRIKRRRGGLRWLRIVTAILWIGILPIACLWAYLHIHRP